MAAAVAWPLSALVERGCESQAQSTIRVALEYASHIANLTSRADALLLLWQAAYPLGSHPRQNLQNALTSACLAASTSKCHHHLRDVALMLGNDFPEEARRIIDLMPDGRYMRQA